MTLLIALQDVRAWLNTAASPMPSTDDALLTRIIGAVSNFATAFLNGPVAPVTVTETYNGNDRHGLPLRQRPVLLVRSVSVNGNALTARTSPTGSGYTNDASTLYESWQRFCRGIQNVVVTYDAGYQTSDPMIVPASGAPLSVTALSRPWNSDRGIAYASGAALTLVTVPPAQGQYQVTADSSATAQYAFNAGDAGAGIVVTYGYTPEDIAQALIELAGERYKTRLRIGQNTQGLAQTTSSFSQRDMNAAIRTLLNPYRQVVPVP